MKDHGFPSINIFSSKTQHTALDDDAKIKKKRTRKVMMIRNPFASRKHKNNSTWIHVPDSPASTKKTIELDSIDEEQHASSEWIQFFADDWSVDACQSGSERNNTRMSIASLAFIDNDLSDWMELEADGTASPRSGGNNNRGYYRRNEYSTYYNDYDDSDEESVLSSVSEMTMDSRTVERGNTIRRDTLDAIYNEIAREVDIISVRTSHDEDSINGNEITYLEIPLMDHSSGSSSCSRSIESKQHEENSDIVVRAVRSSVRRSLRNMLASDQQRSPYWTQLSSANSTYSF
jgi:hypothetical protein